MNGCKSERDTASPTLFGAQWQVAEEGDHSTRIDRRYMLFKRLLDVIIASAVLLLLSPVWLLIALIVKLDSKGPVFFAQDRVGYDPRCGKLTTFKMYKFRSMYHGTDESVHQAYVSDLIRQNVSLSADRPSLKMTNDKRITRAGRWLRKTSLDELPQLINVLLGEMSLVGPRPALLYEVALYEEWQKRRLEALPGMTGWWQVMGRNQVSFDEMVCMDVYYIEHGCLSLDLRILLKTPVAILAGRGAG